MQKLYESFYAKWIVLYFIIGAALMVIQSFTEETSKGSLVSYAAIAFVITLFDLLSGKIPRTTAFIKTICYVVAPSIAILSTYIDRATFKIPNRDFLNVIPWADSLTILSISLLLLAYGISNLLEGEDYNIIQVIEILLNHKPGSLSARLVINEKNAKQLADEFGKDLFEDLVLYKGRDGAIKCNFDNKVLPEDTVYETDLRLAKKYTGKKWKVVKHF